MNRAVRFMRAQGVGPLEPDELTGRQRPSKGDASWGTRMDRRNFLKYLDKKLAELAQARDMDHAAQAASERFAERAVAQILPIAVRYKDDLNARNIEAQLSGNADGLTFQLAYGNGTARALTMYPHPETQRIAFVAYTPGDKRRHARDGTTYDERNWAPEVFEERLQRFIDDFLKAANRHGGIQGVI
jgi:hypothetical protein